MTQDLPPALGADRARTVTGFGGDGGVTASNVQDLRHVVALNHAVY